MEACEFPFDFTGREAGKGVQILKAQIEMLARRVAFLESLHVMKCEAATPVSEVTRKTPEFADYVRYTIGPIRRDGGPGVIPADHIFLAKFPDGRIQAFESGPGRNMPDGCIRWRDLGPKRELFVD